MGVRYYLALSAEADHRGRHHPDLTEVATSGPWVIFEVADAPMVEPLANEPAVTTAERAPARLALPRRRTTTVAAPAPALDWFQDPAR